MKKFLPGGKSRRSKEKKQREQELTKEDNILHGRTKKTSSSSNGKLHDSFVSQRGSTPVASIDSSSSVSMNSAFYRMESGEAVSARENRVIPEPQSLASASSTGKKTVSGAGLVGFKSQNQDDGFAAYHNAERDSGGGKTSGMSEEEIEKSNRQRQRTNRKTESASTKEGSRAYERDNLDALDTSSERKSRHKKDQKQRKSDRDRRTKRSSDLNAAHYDDLIKEDRKMAETDGKMRAATNDYQNNEDDEIIQSRRRRRDQDRKDKKLKESIRQQREAAKEIRKNTQMERGTPFEDQLEQRRSRQQEQEEKDKKMKQSIRQQREAAKELRASAAIGMQPDVGDELEQRRRRQRQQDEKDKKMKQSIKQQRVAAKEIRSNSMSESKLSADEEFEQRRLKRLQRMEEKKKHPRKISFEDDGYDDDPFERALQQEGLERQEEKVEETSDNQQNLIDLHMAQFRATSKIATMDEEDYDTFDVDPNAALEEFEEEEEQRNRVRRMSRRISATTLKINAWHQKYALKKAVELAERTPEMEWVTSFYRCDPRWQIMKFFDEVAREGGEAHIDENLAASPLANLFNKANVFTVWRPTSDEAIKNMMLGHATGKGLDIKGKSAKKGNISSYVPFIQIYEEAHKEHVRAYIKDGKVVRVFYQSEEARREAHEMILDIKDFMLFAAEDAMRVLSDEYADPEEQELAMRHLMYDDNNLSVTFIDTYVNASTPVFGLDITERLFWESYVIMNNCSRPAGTEWDIGRGSEVAFMDMNFKAIRHTPDPGDPRAVVYQMSKTHPMEPRMLLMAYEEYGRVKPVVSDFDCFLLGSRGVKYEKPIPKDQVDLVKWSVKNIREVLEERAEFDSKAGWMETWFKVLKKAALKGFYPKTPKYGNGDPKSYEIIQVAVSRLQSTGCVRHGPECFNWFFPQEIDEEFLVISDTLPGNKKWQKMNVEQLQDILIKKIEEGFTFPINPKWVLCDPGWKRVYDKLMASEKPNVQDSINCWLPPETKLREEIAAILKQHPRGFEGTVEKTEGTEERDLMEADLERYVKLQRAWRKLRLVLYWIRFVREKRREKEEKIAAAGNNIVGW